MTPEFILQLVATVGAGVGIYAGIRVDLARLHEKVAIAQRSAERAHERIDSHF